MACKMTARDMTVIVIIPTAVLIFYMIFLGPDLSGLTWNYGVAKLSASQERSQSEGVYQQNSHNEGLNPQHKHQDFTTSSFSSTSPSSSFSSTSPSSSFSSSSSIFTTTSSLTSTESSPSVSDPATGSATGANRTLPQASRAAFAFRRLLDIPVTTLPYSTLYKNPCWKENGGFYCIPATFLAGFPKCGTTDLYAKLQWHPDVAEKGKEIHWWTRSRFMGRTRQFYKAIFMSAARRIQRNTNMTIIDASPSTIWDNAPIFGPFGDDGVDDPEHLIPYYIHRQLPQAKCVVIMRNPVSRLYSDFLFFGRFAKRSVEAFHRLVVSAVSRFNTCMKTLSTEHCVYSQASSDDLLGRLRIGLYYFHIRTWLESGFPLDQLYWLRLEDYARDAAGTLHGIYDFLELKEIPLHVIQEYVTNSTVQNAKPDYYSTYGQMLPQTKQILKEFYRPYNIKLAELLNDRHLLYEE